MAQPFPIPRQTRASAAFFGDGGSTYGPFDFQIFDVDDVKVIVQYLNTETFVPVAATVTKVSNLPLDSFTVSLAAPIPATTQCIVLSKRMAERSAGVIKGTKIDPTALEKELSKIASTLQEVRRDLDVTLRANYGSSGLVLDSGIPDGSSLVVNGNRLSEGPSPQAVLDAQAAAQESAEDAAASELAAAGSATAAAGSAAAAAGEADQAHALVQQATAGFVGFLDNQGYDFGLVSDPITYFNQDWGTL